MRVASSFRSSGPNRSGSSWQEAMAAGTPVIAMRETAPFPKWSPTALPGTLSIRSRNGGCRSPNRSNRFEELQAPRREPFSSAADGKGYEENYGRILEQERETEQGEKKLSCRLRRTLRERDLFGYRRNHQPRCVDPRRGDCFRDRQRADRRPCRSDTTRLPRAGGMSLGRGR